MTKATQNRCLQLIKTTEPNTQEIKVSVLKISIIAPLWQYYLNHCGWRGCRAKNNLWILQKAI